MNDFSFVCPEQNHLGVAGKSRFMSEALQCMLTFGANKCAREREKLEKVSFATWARRITICSPRKQQAGAEEACGRGRMVPARRAVGRQIDIYTTKRKPHHPRQARAGSSGRQRQSCLSRVYSWSLRNNSGTLLFFLHYSL